jgi:hypothetical protein
MNAFYLRSLLSLGLVVAPLQAPALAVSFSSDFDGRGTGSGFSLSTYRASTYRPPSTPYRASQNNSNPPSTGHYDADGHYDSTVWSPYVTPSVDYERQVYLRQQEEAAERLVLLRQIQAQKESQVQSIQGLLDQLYQLDGVNVRERYHLKYDVATNLLPAFASEQQRLMQEHDSELDRLAHELDTMIVPTPPPEAFGNYSRVFIGGLFYTSAIAKQDQVNSMSDPFTGKAFDGVFGFGAESKTADLARVVGDHFLAELNALTETSLQGRNAEQLSQLKGAHIGELVCHSNGCAVAEVLIASGFIHVRSLRVLNGDCAITCFDSLNRLQEKTGTKVSIYVVKGDIVPLLPTGWQIMEAMNQIGGPLMAYEGAKSAIDEILGVAPRTGFDPTARVSVQILNAPMSFPPQVAQAAEAEVYRHVKSTVFQLITGQRVLGLLDSNGDPKVAAMNF